MAISTTSVGIVPSGNNYEVQFNNNGVFGSSTDFTWNGSALGVGVTSPLQTLDVKGVIRAIRSDANYPTDVRSVDIGYEGGNPRISVVRNDASFDNIDIGVSSDGGSNHTSRLFIDSNGNVFIGGLTSNAGFGASDKQLLLNGATNSRLEFGVGGSQLGGLYANADKMVVYTSGADYLEFDTNSIERMRIDNTGNIGINTISPVNLNSYKFLTITDTSGGGIACQYNGTNKLAVYSANNDGYYDADVKHVFRTGGVFGGSNALVIDSAQNVGIGTDSPVARLDIFGDNTDTSMGGIPVLSLGNGDADDEFSTLKFETGSGGPLAYIGAKADTTGVYPNTAGQLHFAVQDLNSRYTAMVIDQNRNIGIGTTLPSSLLELNSATGPEITIQRDDTLIAVDDLVGGIRFSSNDSSITHGTPPHYGAGIKVKAHGTVGLQNMFLYAGRVGGGNLGYENDAPSMSLYYNGDIFFYNNEVSDTIGFRWDSSESSLLVSDGTINAIEAGYRLHVDGPVFVDAGLGTGLTIAGPAGGNRNLRFHTGVATNNTQRWIWAMDAQAESGSDAGSDLLLFRYNDAGTLLSEAMSIRRSTGNIGIGTGITGVGDRRLTVEGGGGFQLRITRTSVGSGDFGIDNVSGAADVVIAPNTTSSGTVLGYVNSGGTQIKKGVTVTSTGGVAIGDTNSTPFTMSVEAPAAITSAISTNFKTSVTDSYINFQNTGNANNSARVGAVDGTNDILFYLNSAAAFKVHEGGGVSFPAASGGTGVSTSTILDDYEEGTWTPSFSTGGGGTLPSFNYVQQVGRYTKIGRIVHFDTTIQIDAFAGGATSGSLRITGLPFTSASSGFNDTVIIGWTSMFGDSPRTGYTFSGSVEIQLTKSDDASFLTGNTFIDVDKLDIAANGYLRISGVYVV
jgi:hypothetical protein